MYPSLRDTRRLGVWLLSLPTLSNSSPSKSTTQATTQKLPLYTPGWREALYTVSSVYFWRILTCLWTEQGLSFSSGYFKAYNVQSLSLKVHMATRWTSRHGLMLLWFKDLMNVTVKLQFIDPTFRHSCLVINAVKRGPFICSLISCTSFWRGLNRRQEVSRHHHDKGAGAELICQASKQRLSLSLSREM